MEKSEKSYRLNAKVNRSVQEQLKELAKTENQITQGLIVEIALNILFKELETKPLMGLYADYLKNNIEV